MGGCAEVTGFPFRGWLRGRGGIASCGLLVGLDLCLFRLCCVLEVAVEGAFADAEGVRDVSDCIALVTHSGCLTLFGDSERGWASADFSSFACGGEACVGAFAE